MLSSSRKESPCVVMPPPPGASQRATYPPLSWQGSTEKVISFMDAIRWIQVMAGNFRNRGFDFSNHVYNCRLRQTAAGGQSSIIFPFFATNAWCLNRGTPGRNFFLAQGHTFLA